MTEYNYKILASITGTDLARLAFPKTTDLNKLMLSKAFSSQIQLMGEQMSKQIEAQQVKMLGIAPQIAKMAKAIEQKHKHQLEAFQSISQQLQPLISQQTKWAQDISKIGQQVSPLLEAIRTMGSFNAFQRYRETFDEFGGGIDPDKVTQEEIEQTIEENQELIKEVNGVVVRAELAGVSPGDTPALIFSFLIKKVPNLSKKTYGIIVLIFSTVVIFYGLYSNYSTNKTLDKTVVPILKQNTKSLEAHTKDLKEIKDEISENSEHIKKTQEKVSSTQTEIDNLQKDFESYKVETNDKLNLIIEEMKKKDNEKK